MSPRPRPSRRAGHRRAAASRPHIPVIVILFVVFWVISVLLRGPARACGGLWWLPFLFLGGGRGGGWGGGGGGSAAAVAAASPAAAARSAAADRRGAGDERRSVPSDLTAIEAAVRAAEARTTGEIYCVVTEESSHYTEIVDRLGGGRGPAGPGAAAAGRRACDHPRPLLQPGAPRTSARRSRRRCAAR